MKELSKDQLLLLKTMAEKRLHFWPLFPDWFIDAKPRPGFRSLMRPHIENDCLQDLKKLYAISERLQNNGSNTYAVFIGVVVASRIFPQFWEGQSLPYDDWIAAAKTEKIDRFDARLFNPYVSSAVGKICSRDYMKDLFRILEPLNAGDAKDFFDRHGIETNLVRETRRWMGPF